ncbi:MAG: DUF1638 domain-containing protein [Phycisphaerae bacterium]
MNDARRKFKFIGCEIVYREACYLAATGRHHVDVEFLRKGLHDLETSDMVAKVQATIDAVDAAAGYEAILLGYARCNDGLVGVTARSVPLVIPRAHDCISFFFGSRAAYRQHFDAHPGTYYMTTGWSERNSFPGGGYMMPAYGKKGVMAKLGLAEPYEEMVRKYGKENADFIASTLGDWTRNYTHMLYLEMGVCDEAAYIADARRLADENSWRFELRKGDWTLLDKLFAGQWDDDFVIVQPGRKIVARNDELVLDVQ